MSILLHLCYNKAMFRSPNYWHNPLMYLGGPNSRSLRRFNPLCKFHDQPKIEDIRVGANLYRCGRCGTRFSTSIPRAFKGRRFWKHRGPNFSEGADIPSIYAPTETLRTEALSRISGPGTQWRRRNPDLSIRQLERLALEGNKQAIRRLAAMAMRMTLPEDEAEEIAEIRSRIKNEVKNLINCISLNPWHSEPKNVMAQMCKKNTYAWWEDRFPELDPDYGLLLQAQVNTPSGSVNVHTATAYLSSAMEDPDRVVVVEIIDGVGIVPLEELATLFYKTGNNTFSLEDLYLRLEIKMTSYLGAIDPYTTNPRATTSIAGQKGRAIQSPMIAVSPLAKRMRVIGSDFADTFETDDPITITDLRRNPNNPRATTSIAGQKGRAIQGPMIAVSPLAKRMRVLGSDFADTFETDDPITITDLHRNPREQPIRHRQDAPPRLPLQEE